MFKGCSWRVLWAGLRHVSAIGQESTSAVCFAFAPEAKASFQDDWCKKPLLQRSYTI